MNQNWTIVRRAFWLIKLRTKQSDLGLKRWGKPEIKPLNLRLNYSCGTALDLHQTFPFTSDGWSPSEPIKDLALSL